MYSLGIEFSTQSVKLAIVDIEKKETIYTEKFDYDKTFPNYNTIGGVLPSSIPQVRHTSPFMLIEAIDYLFLKLRNDGINLNKIKAIKADAMQHCTVYTNKFFGETVKRLNSSKDLIEQLRETISRSTSPIWEDRSTEEEAKLLTKMLEKYGGIRRLTGNRAELRFPASQIVKWAKQSPEEYRQTSNIFLLSAFLTSILSGKIAPVDTGDGWGTNLNSLNIKNPQWNKKVLNAINNYLKTLGLPPDLDKKIGKIVHYDSKIGNINKYFVDKYGIPSECIILAGTGDNPATLLGCGGNIVISLGTSYTVNGIMKKIVPSSEDEYNIFGYTKGNAMALSCITNGGKVHEHFLRKYVVKEEREIEKKDWDEYIKLAGNPTLSEDEKLMLPYLFDESVPLRKSGFIRDGFDETDAKTNIRALHISQALSLKLHSQHLSKVENLCIVAGGAKNPFLRQIITDLFNAESFTIKNADFAAPLGCAISGARILLRSSYKKVVQYFVKKDNTSILKPLKENTAKSKVLLERYKKLENSTT